MTSEGHKTLSTYFLLSKNLRSHIATTEGKLHSGGDDDDDGNVDGHHVDNDDDNGDDNDDDDDDDDRL